MPPATTDPAGPDTPLRLEAYDPGREAELVALWRESFSFGVGVANPHSVDEQTAYLRTQVLPRCALCLAVLGTRLAGFVAATPEHVDQLYVRVGLHRRGIGRALLAWAQQRSSGRLRLYTFARNRGACAFYERHGFVVERRGVEPSWQLDDVLYRWERGRAPRGTRARGARAA